jgi:hypothetical protein
MRTVFDLYAGGKELCDVAAGVSKGSASKYLNQVEGAIGRRVVRYRDASRSVAALLKDDKGVQGAKRAGGQRRASLRDFHSFRATWVTLALTAGVPLELVQKVTGHKTTDSVLKHYFQPGRGGRRPAEAMREVLEKMTAQTSAATGAEKGRPRRRADPVPIEQGSRKINRPVCIPIAFRKPPQASPPWLARWIFPRNGARRLEWNRARQSVQNNGVARKHSANWIGQTHCGARIVADLIRRQLRQFWLRQSIPGIQTHEGTLARDTGGNHEMPVPVRPTNARDERKPRLGGKTLDVLEKHRARRNVDSLQRQCERGVGCRAAALLITTGQQFADLPDPRLPARGASLHDDSLNHENTRGAARVVAVLNPDELLVSILIHINEFRHDCTCRVTYWQRPPGSISETKALLCVLSAGFMSLQPPLASRELNLVV